ncbi:MAG: hypothetical protein MUF43_09145 [Flavobacterium sp.]|nr:hypothetical protein [Flavobacterium sp.]
MVSITIHLESCQECKNLFQEIIPPNPFHLNYDEHILPFAENTINEIDRKIVEEHIKECSLCLYQINDFKEFVKPKVIIAHSEFQEEKSKSWSILDLFNFRILTFASLLFGIVLIGVFVLFNNFTNPGEGNKKSDKDEVVIGPVKSANQITPIPKPTTKNVADNSDNSIKVEKTPNTGVNSNSNSIPSPKTTPAIPISPANDLPKIQSEATEMASLKLPNYLNDLQTNKIKLQGSEDLSVQKIENLSPHGIVIKSSKPVLNWQKVDNISSYEISIYDKNQNQLKKETVTSNSWQVPITLKKGAIYEWQVFAGKDSKQFLGKGKFYVLGQKADNQIKKAKNSFQRGKALAEAGFLQEAIIEFRNYLKQNPKSKITKEMLRQISKKH